MRIPIDDNVPGAASQACDVGAGSFTVEFWLRGRLQDNASVGGSGDTEFFDFRWIDGDIVVDRDIWGASSRDWGVSIAGGRVRFGTGRADSGGVDGEHTIEGSEVVLNDAWRHVACVRDVASGRKSVYVDGRLDYVSPMNRSRDDISYPDGGDGAPQTAWGPYIVLGAEKHDAGAAYPSFNGFMDEVRVWNVALTAAQVWQRFNRVITPGSAHAAGMVGNFRFEESGGTQVTDSAGLGQAAGVLISNTPGNGLRVRRADDARNVAPVRAGVCVGDFDQSGSVSVQDLFDFLAAWFVGDARASVAPPEELSVQDVFDFLAAWFSGAC